MNNLLNTLRYYSIRVCEEIKILNPYSLSKLLYFLKFHKYANMNHPHNLNEKLMWLTFHTDTQEWTRLADKYQVREYVSQKGLGDILVKLYGVYKHPSEIDFEKLPEKFVLKTNNGFGSVILIDNKKNINKEIINHLLNKWMKHPFGVISAEPHYRKIKPCIIAEELLINSDKSISSSIIDYKFWCFNGKAKYCLTVCNRNIQKNYVDLNLYKLPDWISLHEEITSKYKNNSKVPKPSCLKEMIKYAEILSEDFEVVRVDLYISNSKIYFGELTFTSNGCRMAYFTEKILNEMGNQIK